jgi:hypothetical protein
MSNKFLELLTLHAKDFEKNPHLLKNNLIIAWNGEGAMAINTTLEFHTWKLKLSTSSWTY